MTRANFRQPQLEYVIGHA